MEFSWLTAVFKDGFVQTVKLHADGEFPERLRYRLVKNHVGV